MPLQNQVISLASPEEASMKIWSVVAWFLVLGCAAAQTQSGSQQPAGAKQADHQPSAAAANPAVQTSQTDLVKAADIRQLMEVAGTKAVMSQMMETMGEGIKPLMANALPPGEYREKLIDLFFVKFKSKADTQKLLDSIVPLYDKYLSDEEIKGLIKFYQTPLGQKTVKVMPKLMAESQEQGGKWGEALGRESMLEVLAEHPELEKAMEDAGKGAPPK
jgi:hypothetical protein